MRLLLAVVLLGWLSRMASAQEEPPTPTAFPTPAVIVVPALDPGQPAVRPRGVAMPDVRGVSLDEAARRLLAAGIAQYDVVQAQVGLGWGGLLRQAPPPGVVVTARGYRPSLEVGVPLVAATAAPPSVAGVPKGRGAPWWPWLLLLVGTCGMGALTWAALLRWRSSGRSETPGVQVTRRLGRGRRP